MTLDVTRSANPTRRGKARIAIVSEADRLRAFGRAKRHSWLVRALKVTLPLLAVVSAAGLFLSPTMLLRLAAPGVNASVAAVQVTTDQLRMVNPRFDGSTADNGHYVVTAKAAVQRLDAPDVMQLETVHGHIIQVDNSWTDLTSKAGTYWTKTKALRLNGGIVITTSADMRAELDAADVDVDKKVVTSDAEVTMTMPNGKLRGKGLLIENTARRLLLREAVTAHLTPPKRAAATPAAPAAATVSATPAMSDAPVDIAARQLEILDNAKTATFSGSVEAVQAGMTMRSERMEVGYAGAPGAATPAVANSETAAQNVNYVTASKNVVITTLDGRKATCDQSRYDRKANTMTLQGAVVLNQKASELHADTVVYDMATKSTHVTARNRVSGHFEPDGGAGAIQGTAATGLSGLGSQHGATDITADVLDIADGDNRAVFQGTVIVSQRGNKLTGDRLQIDMAKRHMAMSGPGRVSGTFEATAAPAHPVKPGKTVVAAAAAPGLGQAFTGLSAGNSEQTNVESDALTVEDDHGEAIFTGNVVVVRGGHRISAGTLTVNYTGGGEQAHGPAQLARIRAKDHVVVHTPDGQTASSEWLLYDPGHNQLTMGGNVTVAQGDNIVHGEKLIVDLTTGESHFETRADETALPLAANAPKPSGRIQVLITPQGIQQIGGPPVANAPAPVSAKPKEAMSASDVMVAPDAPQ